MLNHSNDAASGRHMIRCSPRKSGIPLLIDLDGAPERIVGPRPLQRPVVDGRDVNALVEAIGKWKNVRPPVVNKEEPSRTWHPHPRSEGEPGSVCNLGGNCAYRGLVTSGLATSALL